ncbi:DUF2652 domain-containing protein [Nocardioides sp. Soil805]|uniref:DUF2652 domain-containing protein n=1 Tax=Nocardioides sp. Soil805 TaxID=1736416 RepID=UPI000703366F|nr:DUF2652 domain-containing protein [Nocardioides sp. Soil805]KRF34405.1 hypothetical protein ASG94_17100 [Nocardioides sp. Soil805]
MSSVRALMLIADIGGYTEYMSTHRMSLAHAQVNTGRLLERVIDAAPGLELIEIEGDAAFLYREAGSTAPDLLVREVTDLAAAMHRAFHLEREYVARNLCPCSGCKQAANLTLKFVAHVGDVATQTIRQRRKLVGIDVILVHRLLKNTVPVREYVLLTDDLLHDSSSLRDSTREISPDVEGFGPVRAHYVDVMSLDPAAAPLPGPTWRGRLARTAYAAGAGLPYMLGRRRRHPVGAAK